jgi:hypothetical protein
MYIVAFSRYEYPGFVDQPETGEKRDYINLDLDAERKVRKRIEQWTYLKVAEKLSQADFVFLVISIKVLSKGWLFHSTPIVNILRSGSIWISCEKRLLGDI